jgi:hypothetical protein
MPALPIMQRIFDFLRVHDLPPLTRRNYTIELRQVALWGAVSGAVEGSIAGIIASKTFHASPAVTALVWALPNTINVLSLVWSALIRGWPRVYTSLAFTVCSALAIASVAATPPDWRHASWLFAGQIACTHLFLCALITLRTTMWQMNYPDSHRARITGRLTTVRVLTALATGVLLTNLYDHDPTSYRLAFPAVALVGLASGIPLRRLRVRGEKAARRALLRHVGALHPIAALWRGLRESYEILRQDRLFAQYMGAQFLLGSANFFTEPLLINMVTKEFALGYFASAALITVIPTITLLIGIRYWAPLFDRVGVLHFRVVNSTMWLLSFAGTTAAMLLYAWRGPAILPVTLALLAVARIGTGLGNGGGALAWNLGHLAFARPHQTELYMGIHVFLTGLRAIMMPFIGLWVMQQVGLAAFAVSIVLAATANVLFRRMRIERKQ